MHVPLLMCDSAGNILTDALSQPLPTHGGRVAGYVCIDQTEDAAHSAALAREWQKAPLSARYKGGLADGDFVRLADRQMQVTGRNPETNKIQLADTTQVDGDTMKLDAYNASVREMTDAWKTRHDFSDQEPGGACTTGEGKSGKWRRGADGKLVCMPTVSAKLVAREFEIGGPLSDAAAGVEARREAYEQSVRQLQDAWRK